MAGIRRPFILAVALALTGTAAASPPAAPAAEPDCSIRPDRAADAPRFEDFPAAMRPVTRQAGLILDTAQARRHRSLLAGEAAQGPNFAGTYTIAAWGCGAACTAFAIIDARTGRVHFPAGFSRIVGVHVGGYGAPGPPRYANLRFRPDSRLLVVLGAPEGDEARHGAAWFEWTGTALRPLRFVPRRDLCGQAEPAHH